MTKLRLGTRGSPLALEQARLVAEALGAAHGWAPGEQDRHLSIVTIKTSGDRIQDRSLAELGGKGLFAKELEEALREGRIDFAVHSAKDLPSDLPEGMEIAAVLPRADPRDAFVSLKASSLSQLSPGARLGTNSVRRIAIVKRLRPDLETVLFRGNVETRLKKLEEGVADATILAMAGLTRLGLQGRATGIFTVEEMLPAAGQGIIAIETRQDAHKVKASLAPIDHLETRMILYAERAFLLHLNGSCKSPIAAYAESLGDEVMAIRGQALSLDGSEVFESSRLAIVTKIKEAEVLGMEMGVEILDRAGREFFQ